VVKILFAENPGVIIQVRDEQKVTTALNAAGVTFSLLGRYSDKRELSITHGSDVHRFDIDELRDVWFSTSYALDKKQRPALHAERRFKEYKKQPLKFDFPNSFNGSFERYGIDPRRRQPTGLRSAIIREKGVNGDREMAYTLYLAGFDVKDVHMTDLASGREDLSDVHLIVFVGGFSNSDVLGSAKGWAGAFLYNDRARQTLERFYAREDTLSLGVCNGCQLMMELGLLYPDWKEHPRMHHNGSGKFESAFVNVTIPESNSVMLGPLAGARLGVWLAHGEGRFVLPEDQTPYNIAATFSYEAYPGNPNDSAFATAALTSKDGRHLAIMPHLERSLFPWNWGYYPPDRKADVISPWIAPFYNAREWVNKHS
jgi:phosphoribosylformylglycinamidine synthase